MSEFAKAVAVLETAADERVFPGAAFGVLHGGKAELGQVGRLTYAADSPAVSAETIYDIASLTKVMATTALAMRLWQRNELDLEMRVAELRPQFGETDAERQKITLRMLLAHTSGLPAYRALYELREVQEAASAEDSARAVVDACMATPLENAPGAVANYSDIGFILLGQALKVLTGVSKFDELCAAEIFSPLSLAFTCFKPAAELRERIAPTCDWRWRRRVLQGEVQDENCAAMGGVASHAGVFATCTDVLAFAAEVLQPEVLFEQRTIELFSERALGSRALGWDTPSQPSQSGRYFSARSVGHLGYTGTSLWIDLKREIAIVLLTNRVYTGPEAAPADANGIKRVRPAFHDAVMRQILGL